MIVALSGLMLYHYLGGTYDLYVVVTGSMEPAIPRGSIILVRSINISAGEHSMVGDILAYRSPGSVDVVFAHRLIAIEANGTLILKGDAVNSTEVVDPRFIAGVVVAGVPGGIYLAIALPYIAFILLVLSILEGKE